MTDTRLRAVAEHLIEVGVACSVGGIMTRDPDGETTVARGRSGSRDVIVKLASTTRGAERLQRHADAVDAVRRTGHPRLLPLVPEILVVAGEGDRLVTVETSLKGRRLDERHGPAARRGERQVLDVLADVHRIGTHTITPGVTEYRAWIDEPVAGVRQRVGDASYDAPLGRLRDELAHALDRPLTVGCVHGDPWPGNLLVSASGTVTGIVDWESSRRLAPPDADLAQFVLLRRNVTIGSVMAGVLANDELPEGTSVAARHAFAQTPNQLGARHAFLLGWLWHVSDNIRKAVRYRGPWLTANVAAVLDVADRTRA